MYAVLGAPPSASRTMWRIATNSPSSLSMVSITRTRGAYVRATVLARPVVLSLTATGYGVRFELLTLREPGAKQRPLPSPVTGRAVANLAAGRDEGIARCQEWDGPRGQ
jgi:hypothetical protein